MVALALRLLLQWMRSHLGTCHTRGTTWATQTWQTRVTPATNNALRTWFTWCALFKRRSDQSIWNIFNIQFVASYSWQIQSLSTWLNEYLPFLLVHLVALFHLLRQAHLLLQQVLDHRENRRYQGVQEAHPCLQARHYQGDLDYPRKNFRKKSVSCIFWNSSTQFTGIDLCSWKPTRDESLPEDGLGRPTSMHPNLTSFYKENPLTYHLQSFFLPTTWTKVCIMEYLHISEAQWL